MTAREVRSQNTQSPADFVRPDLVILGMEAISPLEVIRALAQRLEAAGFVHPTFADAVCQREETNPTGLPLAGDIHVAIPHADTEHVIAPALAVATLVRPVPFRNMVNPEEVVHVSIVIVMALNEAHAQVEMLQQLAYLFQDSERVQRLYKAQSFKDVERVLRGDVSSESERKEVRV